MLSLNRKEPLTPGFSLCEQSAVDFRVDVTAADNAAHRLALELVRFREERPDRERACRLDFQIGETKEQPRSFLDDLLRHFHDPREAILQNASIVPAEAHRSCSVSYRLPLFYFFLRIETTEVEANGVVSQVPST